MSKQRPAGFVILDRKSEYIKDTIDQRGNRVYGLQHHQNAPERMVVVSTRSEFTVMKQNGIIYDHLEPIFSLRDIHPPVDLADFLPGLTSVQADLIRDYAYIPNFYDKLLAESPFGAIDKSNWYTDFPGLFDLNSEGKKLLKKIERDAAKDGRTEMTDEERE